VIVLAKEDTEVDLHGFQTMIEQFQLELENCIVVRKLHLYNEMHLITLLLQ
jgi:hypothetical protein